MPEEIKNGACSPPLASEGLNQGGTPPTSADSKAELENLQKQLAEKDKLISDKDRQLGQAGFNIQKYKQMLKDNGIEEEEGKLGADEVQEIVQKTVQTELEKITEPLKTQISELGRTLTSRANANPGGVGGQELPKKEGEPEPILSEDDMKIVNSFGGKWDPKRKGYVTKSGRFVDLSDKSGIAAA